jgi:hypothetical protein
MSNRPLIRAMTLTALLTMTAGAAAGPPEGQGWTKLFNGEDLTGWEVSEAGKSSWSVVDGVIDCDPRAKEGGDRHLWTEEAYGDFTLHVEWRIKKTPARRSIPLVRPDGSYMRDKDGNVIKIDHPNADSGILLRGQGKSQVNIWCWPVGSGEVYGYRNDKNQPATVRRAVTPLVNADKPVGEWNTFRITMKDDRLTVVLNGAKVIDEARLPGVPESGPIALQYHGGLNHETGEYSSASSLVQFRNVYIKELD